MFNKKKIKELEKTIETLKYKNQRLEENNDNLRTENRVLREQLKEKIEENYNEYDYAILVNGIEIKLWNQGRFEEKVKGITFNTSYRELPELEIRK